MTEPGDPDWPTFPNGQPIPQTHAGHPCKDCHQNAEHGDGPCWREPHGGTTPIPGAPTKLTQELADRAAELVEHGDGPHDQPWLIKNVWAHDDIDVWESTWYDWLDRGRQDLENGENTVYAYFARVIARADRQAQHYWHSVLTDGMIHRSEEISTDDGSEFVPLRLDPRTGKEVGETVETRHILDYMARRWPEQWSEKFRLKHEGRVEIDRERAIPDEALEDPETIEALETLSQAKDRNGEGDDGGAS